MPDPRFARPGAESLLLSGPLQPQLVLLIDTLTRDVDEPTAALRQALACRVHAALGLAANECLARLGATITESDRALLIMLADRHELRTPPAAANDPAERLRRLEPARRYRDAAQVLAMLAELAAA